MFVMDETPFRLVIEEAEYDEYAKRFGGERILVLPFSDRGLTAARNWIRDHAEAEGHMKHWQFDDNIRRVQRLWGGKRLNMRAGIGLAAAEDFTGRYTNVAISGFNYTMFVPETTTIEPFYTNVRVYSASLINHASPARWRRVYNDDTDLCLQVLANGWCTILFNAFLVDKIWTGRIKGGNTDDLYGAEYDGRLKMARSLERDWPGVVTTKRRFQRPQHVVKGSWHNFDTPLIRDETVEIPTEPNEYGMRLVALEDVKSKRLRGIAAAYNAKNGETAEDRS
jgi:hypothetical protein